MSHGKCELVEPPRFIPEDPAPGLHTPREMLRNISLASWCEVALPALGVNLSPGVGFSQEGTDAGKTGVLDYPGNRPWTHHQRVCGIRLRGAEADNQRSNAQPQAAQSAQEKQVPSYGV